MAAVVPAAMSVAGLGTTGGLVTAATKAYDNYKTNKAYKEAAQDAYQQKVQTLDTAYQAQAAALKNLENEILLDEHDLAQGQATKQAELAAEKQTAEAKRKATLKRALAAVKAGAASRGVSADSGSTEALLQGIIEDSNAEADAEDVAYSLETKALSDELLAAKRRNLLELNELVEKQRLERLTWEL